MVISGLHTQLFEEFNTMWAAGECDCMQINRKFSAKFYNVAMALSLLLVRNRKWDLYAGKSPVEFVLNGMH